MCGGGTCVIGGVPTAGAACVAGGAAVSAGAAAVAHGATTVVVSSGELAEDTVSMMSGGGGGGARNLRSLINNDKRLIKEAEIAGKSHQTGLDHLVKELSKGNLNPGIGTKKLFGNISYARHRDGSRVFFRQGADGSIEILAKSNKANEQRVINILYQLYN